MPNNFLITGRPGSGKSTVIEKTVSELRDRGLTAAGVYCPEIREGGIRKGFEMVDVVTGNSKILAHVDQPRGPRISKYRVNVANVDEMSQKSIEGALGRADFIVIDEIAPMETYSDEFKGAVKKVLDSQKPVLAVIHQRLKSGFIGRVKERSDVRIFQITSKNRDILHMELANAITKSLD